MAPESMAHHVAIGAALVWTPETPWMVVPAEVPGLQPIVLDRARKVARSRMNGSAVQCVIWGLVALFQSGAAAETGQPSWAWFLFVGMGLLPLLWNGFEWRRLQRAERIDWNARVIEQRFALWIRAQRTPFTLALGVLLGGLFILQASFDLERSIEMTAVRRDLVLQGEWWRLATAGLVHGGGLHAFLNITTLLVLGSQIEPLIGGSRLLATFFFSVLVASLASISWSDRSLSVGASGGLFGCMGAFMTYGWRGRHLLPHRVLGSIVTVIALNIVIGWIGREFIDNAAHLGGLFAGILAGSIAGRGRFEIPLPASPTARAAGALTALGVLAAAALAATRIAG